MVSEAADNLTKTAENVGSPETPENFVPLYISIRKESLDFVRQNGFRVEDNQMAKRSPILEEIFSQVGGEMGSKIDRTRCVFAHPRTPDTTGFGLSFDESEDVLIQVLVNPKDCVVANGEYYTEAGFQMSRSDSKEEIRTYAKAYWETVKPLEKYLEEEHTGEAGDFLDFVFPEVLIPSNIPTDRIKILTGYKLPN